MRGHATVAAVIVGGVAQLTGCAYHNTIYNAQAVFERAEASRVEGRPQVADSLYREVISKTSEAYRARPGSDWAIDALYLLGRSRLRLGEDNRALDAFTTAEESAPPRLRASLRVYRAAVLDRRGDRAGAMALVNEALAGDPRPEARAEAHLMRGAWLLEAGRSDQGWWDLDRAAEWSERVRVEAAITRLRWSIRHGDPERARRAVDLLLSYPEGGSRLPAITGELRAAGVRWGEAVASELVAGAASARWEREARGRIRLERARLLNAAGDTAAASAEAWEVARGLGDAAAEARLQVARWHLQRTEDLVDAYDVRPILLPIGTHPEAALLSDAVDDLQRFSDVGLEEPLGWFAAAEVARDRLGADYLARGLFLAYAAGAPEEPWVPKALLAALEVSPNEGDRAWLRGRLETHAGSPYVLAARGGPGAGFEALEEELQVRITGLRVR